MNTYDSLRFLAKSIKFQNIFIASKEHSGINLFRNHCDFSELQENFLSMLYNYSIINDDIILNKISPKTIEKDIYADSYLIWKRTKGIHTHDTKSEQHDVSLVRGTKITYPKR